MSAFKLFPYPKTVLHEPEETTSWKRGRRLGRGGYGSVHIGYLRTGSVVAVKTAAVSVSESLKKEARLLPKFHGCPYIVHSFGSEETDENGVRLYNLFLEYAERGSLAVLIKTYNQGTGLPESRVKKYVKAILLGLNAIHGLGYVHCDIKPQNILLDGQGGVKIADFGLAMEYVRINMNKSHDKRRSRGPIGTLQYMSPEIAREELYAPPADIWALGCSVVYMITGKSVWDSPNKEPYPLLYRIMTEGVPEIPTSMSPEAADFVTKCLVEDPSKRWTAEMLLDHPFVVDVGCSSQNVVEEINDPRNNILGMQHLMAFDAAIGC